MNAAPWADLVALAELERDLIDEGRWEELAQATAARTRASLALGAPPAEARVHLERLAVLQAHITASVGAARAFTMQKMGGVQRSRRAVSGYVTAGYASTRPRVDGRG